MKVNMIMPHKFIRLEKIIGKEKVTDLFNKSVLVLGCGGVGGYVIESLARSNIGCLGFVIAFLSLLLAIPMLIFGSLRKKK